MKQSADTVPLPAKHGRFRFAVTLAVRSGKGAGMRVIWPDDQNVSGSDDRPVVAVASSGGRAGSTDGDEAVILRFPAAPSGRDRASLSSPSGGVFRSPADRARLIHRNSICRHCRRALVSLVLAEDGRRDGTGNFVPGSQTLIGFRCECCHREWSE